MSILVSVLVVVCHVLRLLVVIWFLSCCVLVPYHRLFVQGESGREGCLVALCLRVCLVVCLVCWLVGIIY